MKYYILIISLFMLSSCGIYRQNVTNVPLMEQKGQAQISGHIGFTGYDCQIAYSATKHLGIIANYSDIGTERKEYSSTNYSVLNHRFGEIGAGYYTNNKKGLIAEYFLVFGRGKTSESGAGGETTNGNTIPYTNFNSANYNRFLFQADYGKSTVKFEYAFSPRIFILNYYNVSDSQDDTYKDLPSSFFWSDYALTLRYKPMKHVKLSGQISLTLPITGYKAAFYEASPINCSFGLIINMNIFKNMEQK